jgi:hypothetical protein
MQPDGENYNVNVYESMNAKRRAYKNVVDRDYRKIAQILIDLNLLGFPMEKAMLLAIEKIKRKDWLSF